MYILDNKKDYTIYNNIIYENGIPIIDDTTKIMPNWEISSKQSFTYLQSTLFTYSKRFKLIQKMEKQKNVVKRFFYDLETTGVNWRRCSIHQLSAYIEIDGVIVETINMNIKPHEKAEITQEALTICGVTEEQIQAYPDMKTQFKYLRDTLDKYVDMFDKTDKFFFVGFKNASFDDDFLKKYFDLMDVGFWLYFWPSSIDVSVLAAQYLIKIRHTMPSFKLHRVAKTVGLEVDDSRLHDAMYDVELTRDVYRIVGRLEENLF